MYRAVVRGKVEGFTAGSVGEAHERGLATARARNYFDLADYYIRYAQRPFNPVVFMGLSGSGKSTIASGICTELLNSDDLMRYGKKRPA